jgi:hypothetical protein
MSDIYVFDSNPFIYMERYCPHDVFETFWKKIESLISEGVIISSDEVLEEINRGDDSLVEWAKGHKGMFIASNEVIQREVRQILRSFPKLVISSKKANEADPFVIALAKTRNAIVVSEEKEHGLTNPKIPDVCKELGIPCIRLTEFYHKAGIKI